MKDFLMRGLWNLTQWDDSTRGANVHKERFYSGTQLTYTRILKIPKLDNSTRHILYCTYLNARLTKNGEFGHLARSLDA
jgi:hypothetical protein